MILLFYVPSFVSICSHLVDILLLSLPSLHRFNVHVSIYLVDILPPSLSSLHSFNVRVSIYLVEILLFPLPSLYRTNVHVSIHLVVILLLSLSFLVHYNVSQNICDPKIFFSNSSASLRFFFQSNSINATRNCRNLTEEMSGFIRELTAAEDTLEKKTALIVSIETLYSRAFLNYSKTFYG